MLPTTLSLGTQRAPNARCCFLAALHFGAEKPRSPTFISSTRQIQLEHSTDKTTLCSRLFLALTLALPGWGERHRPRDSRTEGHVATLTEKVVLVTSLLLCTMPPLRLPGMPPPWCFFWLPTIVSMEWLRTRMALCSQRGQGDRGQQVSTALQGHQPQTLPPATLGWDLPGLPSRVGTQ